MGGDNSGQQAALGLIGKGVDELSAARSQYLSSPLFADTQGIAGQVAAQPLSLGPQQIAQIKGADIDAAQNQARGALNQVGETAAAHGGIRSGGFLGQSLGITQRLGQTVADVGRQVDEAAARQRLQDLSGSYALLNTAANAPFQFSRDIANMYGGGAQSHALAPTPGIGAGLGGILGTVAGKLIPGAPDKT